MVEIFQIGPTLRSSTFWPAQRLVSLASRKIRGL